MDNYVKNLAQISIAVLAIFVFGTLGYYFIEDNWTLFDSFYMVAISITTVGYGEIREMSTAGRILSIVIIFLGLGVAASFATQLVRIIIEGELTGIYGRRKMGRRIKHMKEHYIVCGHGRTGGTICLKLHERDIPFVVIESDKVNVALAEERGFPTVEGDATRDAVLIDAGIENALGVVVSIPDDSTSLFISMAARELNASINIIAQGSGPEIEKRLLRAGANTIVYPLRLGGEQIARLIAQKHEKFIEETEESSEWDVHGFFFKVYKHYNSSSASVKEILEKTRAVSAVSYFNSDSITTTNPAPELILNKGESLILVMDKAKGSTGQSDDTSPELLVWSDKLSIGIGSIDEEHMTLVQIINDFQSGLAIGTGAEQIAPLFDKLLAYTVIHFNNEEALMDKYAYPKKNEHKAKHHDLTTQVMDINKDKKYIFPGSVSGFLVSWLTDHILGTDMEFAEFLKEQGVC
ncbi:MAG: bacteriohemerythrin [Fibrobacteria bacterium]|nr:bacteriohemerythrin [Fibrobacteria bacterium]